LQNTHLTLTRTANFLAKAKLGIRPIPITKRVGTASMAQAIQWATKISRCSSRFLPGKRRTRSCKCANAHYQQMAKPNRDRSEARAAEEIPNVPIAVSEGSAGAEGRAATAGRAGSHAEGDYRLGLLLCEGRPASRCGTLCLRSQSGIRSTSRSDRVLVDAGDIFERTSTGKSASTYYGNIVKNYPLRIWRRMPRTN